jgi:hypothetical protein
MFLKIIFSNQETASKQAGSLNPKVWFGDERIEENPYEKNSLSI